MKTKWIDTNKKIILEYIKNVFLILLFSFGFYSIFWGPEEYYETIRMSYCWRGILCLLIAYVIGLNIHIIRKWIWLIGIILIAGLMGYLLHLRVGLDIWRWYCYRGLSIILIFCFLLNAIIEKKIIKFSRLYYIAIIVTLSALVVLILSRRAEVSWIPLLLCGFVCLLDVDKEKWNHIIELMLWGYVSMGMKVMVQAFISVPYEGDRYYGLWGNHGLFGSGIGGCVIALIILLYFTLSERRRCYIYELLLECVLLAANCVFVMIISARISMMGILFASYITLFIFCLRRGAYKKLLLISAGFILLLTVFVLSLYFLQRIPIDRFSDINNVAIRNQILYWRDRGDKLFMKESRTGFFKGGTLLNSIDAFSSRRLTYALKYFEHMNLWGHESLWVFPDDFDAICHPHNTYIAWLYLYGIIGGSTYILSFLLMLIYAIKNTRKDTSAIPAAIFGVYMFGLFFNDVFMNYFVETIIFFMLMRPVLVKTHLQNALGGNNSGQN